MGHVRVGRLPKIRGWKNGYEIAPTLSGIYVILGDPPIHRVRGKDCTGIL